MTDLAIVATTAEPLPPDLLDADLVDSIVDLPVFDGRAVVNRGA